MFPSIRSASKFEALDLALVVSTFLVAVILRLYRLATMKFDYYGDSYHHWLISYLTARNGYLYTDFKPNTMNIVWLPLFHYLVAFLMNATGVYDITVLHMFNIILGALTCVVVYRTVSTSGSRWIAFASGISLAVQPWFIEVNCLGITETLCCLLLIAALYSYKSSMSYTALFTGLAMLTRYEGWFFAILIFILALIHGKLNRKTLLIYVSIIIGVVILWMTWSFVRTGNLLTWYIYQRNMVRWDFEFIYGQSSFSLNRLISYPDFMSAATTGLFPLSLLLAGIALRKNQVIQVFTFITLGYVAFLSLQFASGYVLFEFRQIAYIFPMVSILLFTCIADLRFKAQRRRIIHFAMGSTLLLLTLVPIFYQSSLITQRRPLTGEGYAGLALKAAYQGGYIISDSPVVIYYSGIRPENFLPSLDLNWYAKSRNRSALEVWLKSHDVRYIVWENTSYTELEYLFPQLSGGDAVKLYGISFSPFLVTRWDESNLIDYRISFS